MYMDAAQCHSRSSVVCLSVCRSVTIVSPAKAADLMEMPFGLWNRVGPRNHILDECPDPPREVAFNNTDKYGYSSSLTKVATRLQELTCHMASHSVTCHPSEVTFQPLPQPKLVLDLTTPEGCN